MADQSLESRIFCIICLLIKQQHVKKLCQTNAIFRSLIVVQWAQGHISWTQAIEYAPRDVTHFFQLPCDRGLRQRPAYITASVM